MKNIKNPHFFHSFKTDIRVFLVNSSSLVIVKEMERMGRVGEVFLEWYELGGGDTTHEH